MRKLNKKFRQITKICRNFICKSIQLYSCYFAFAGLFTYFATAVLMQRGNILERTVVEWVTKSWKATVLPFIIAA